LEFEIDPAVTMTPLIKKKFPQLVPLVEALNTLGNVMLFKLLVFG
jgi:hypothetical protein